MKIISCTRVDSYFQYFFPEICVCIGLLINYNVNQNGPSWNLVEEGFYYPGSLRELKTYAHTWVFASDIFISGVGLKLQGNCCISINIKYELIWK